MKGFLIPGLVALLAFVSGAKSDFTCMNGSGFGTDNLVSLTRSNVEKEFYAFYNDEFDATVLIQEGHQIDRSVPATALNITASYISVPATDITVSPTIAPTQIPSGEKNFLFHSAGPVANDPFGQEIEVATGDFAGKLYLPKRIYVDMNSSVIAAGNQLTWNADAANKRGVIVRVDFSNSLQLDPGFEQEESISRVYWTEDDGDFVLPQELLEDFKDGADLTLQVIRGNFTMLISADGQHNCRVYGLTHADTFLKCAVQ